MCHPVGLWIHGVAGNLGHGNLDNVSFLGDCPIFCTVFKIIVGLGDPRPNSPIHSRVHQMTSEIIIGTPAKEDPPTKIQIMFKNCTKCFEHFHMFAISAVQFLITAENNGLGDVEILLVNFYLQRRKIMQHDRLDQWPSSLFAGGYLSWFKASY